MSRAQEILQLIASFEDELASMQAARDQISELMRPFEEKRRAYRQELLGLMVGEGVGRMHGSGFSAVVSKRTSARIADESAVRVWLIEKNCLDAYLCLDAAKVLAAAKNHVIPGVETVEKPELRLTPKEEKK